MSELSTERRRELTVKEAIIEGNAMPHGTPAPTQLAELVLLYQAAVHRMLNKVVRAKVVEIEGGIWPELTVAEKQLRNEITPTGIVTAYWRDKPIVMFVPAGYALGPAGGLEWQHARVDILSEDTRIHRVGQS